MVVHPGDIIVGDQDGVFAIRPEIADELAKLVADIEKKEKEIFVKIVKGTLDRSWVDQALRAKGILK
jgi:regulator of RNase E activity RraA